MWTAHSPFLPQTHTHTHTNIFCVCVCVCDSVIDIWRIFWTFFFSPFLLFFVLHGWSKLLYRLCIYSLPEKDFKEITIILLSFFLVFQMQKECFSLPAIKATITLFLYTNGAKKKNLYESIYKYIHANAIGVQGGITQLLYVIPTRG